MNKEKFLQRSSLNAGPQTVANRRSDQTARPSPAELNISNPDKQNICKTCGTRYSAEKYYKGQCSICMDDRQYLSNEGQQWVSFSNLSENHAIKLKKHTEQLYEVRIVPDFAISQRAFFIRSETGNILWDCIPLITWPIVDFIQKNGGIKAIAISHPHYFSLMNEWAKAFHCPIYIHQDNRKWIMDREEHIEFWSGNEYQLTNEATLIHTGGHFPGSSILHSELDQLGKTLFIGDSLFLSRDKKHLSAMYSYPNVIPLANAETLRVFNVIAKYEFDALFGAFDQQDIYKGGREVFEGSFNKYRSAFRKA